MARINIGVLSSDSVTRNHTKFTVGALHHGLIDMWRRGIPQLLSHDAHRPVGWTRALGLHFEPGLVRLLGIHQIAETEGEFQSFGEVYTAYRAHITAQETEPDLPTLRAALAAHLDGSERPHYQSGTMLVGTNLARRALSKLFDQEDKDGLITLKELTPIWPGIYRFGNLVLFAHPYFRRSLSRFNNLNAELLGALEDISKAPGGDRVRIRLDPDAVGLAESVYKPVELEYWYGPKFNDDIKSIAPGVTRHEANDEERFFHSVSRTEFWWQSRLNKETGIKEHILEVEELRDRQTFGREEPTYGCRYVHCIVEEPTNTIDHLDGAVREYDDSEIITRLDKSIAEAGRNTMYTKLWRLDGTIDLSTMKMLIHHFFRNNPQIGEYFGTRDESDHTIAPEAVLPPREQILQRLVPYSMKKGDGVRLLFSHHATDENLPTATRCVIPSSGIETETEAHFCVASNTIELQKILRRAGEDLFIPDGTLTVVFLDLYTEFPLIWHASPAQLQATIDAFRVLLHAWLLRGDDRVVALSLGVVVGDHEERLSVLGHIDDVDTWLARSVPFPPADPEAAATWLEEVANNLAQFPIHYDTPKLGAIINTSATFHLDRVRLQPEMYQPYYDEERHGLYCQLKIPKEESDLVAAVQAGRVTAKPALITGTATCTKCNESYNNCPCIRFLEEGVGLLHRERKFLFFYWTDRPAPHARQPSPVSDVP